MKSKPSGESASGKLNAADWVVQAGAVDDVLEALKSRLAKRTRRRRAAGGAAALGVLIALTAFWVVPYVRETDTVATRPAQRQTLTLADGTRADLNAQTALFADFRHDRRTVRLDRGEAFFAVAKDPAHPFLVHTPAGTVRVTGTEFNVRLTEGGMCVTLLEGAVDVAPPAGSGKNSGSRVSLVPGQQVQLANGTSAVRGLGAGDLERVTAWRHGRALFEGETLAEAAERFADFHGVTIMVDAEASRLRVGGSYPLHELREFLHALEKTLPVKVADRGDGFFRIAASRE